MECIIARNLLLKSGITIPKGTVCQVSPINDMGVQIYSHLEQAKIKGVNMYKYFDEFISISDEEMMDAMCDSNVYSIAGNGPVEPDGHDEYGFPSILLAMGVI